MNETEPGGLLGWMVGGSVRHARTLAVFALVVVVLGGWQLRQAKVDALPEFSPPTVVVQTEALGLSAPEMEQLITFPLEQNFLNGIPFLKTIRSRSVPGLSNVELVFEPDADLFTARQLVQERLGLTSELPNVAKPPKMLQATASTSRAMMVGLASKARTPIELSQLAKYTIAPRLLGVPGVANVSIFGQRDLQLQVQIDPNRLASQGVALEQVVATAGNALFVSPLTFLEASTPGSGGFFDTANQRLGVQHILPIKTPEDLARVSVVDTAGAKKLGDVASVVEDHQPLIGDAVLGGGPGLLLVIERLPDANTGDLTAGVRAALDDLRPGLAGVDIDTEVYQPAAYVDRAAKNLRTAVLAAVVLLFLVLTLLFWDWRVAFVAIDTAAVAVVVPAWIIHARGLSIDSMVVAGLLVAVTVVVHDLVLVLRDGAHAAGRNLTFATVLGLTALVPVLALGSSTTRPFLPEIAGTYALSLVVSLVLALTLAPAFASLMLPADFASRPRPIDGVLQRYERARGRLSARPVLALALAAVLALLALGAALQIAPRLRPTFRENALVVQWDARPGTSLTEVARVLGRASAELRQLKGVKDVGSHVGRALAADQVVGAASGQLWLDLDVGADHAATVAAVRKVVAGYPGVNHRVFSYFDDRVREIQRTREAPLLVRIYGQDYNVMRSRADEVKKLLGGVRGVSKARIETPSNQPTIQVEVDLAAAQARGVKPGDVRRAATTLIAGLEVGSLYENQQIFQVVVVGSPSVRQSLTTVEDIVVDTPDGAHVRLGDVAKVRIGPSPTVIKHEDVSRSLDVIADVRGRSTTNAAADVRARLKSISFPLEYNAKVIAAGDPGSGLGRLLGGVLALAILAVLLLEAAFGSWNLAGVVTLTAALSLTGGVVGAWLDGRTLSLGSVAGLLAVGALAVRSQVTAAWRLCDDASGIDPTVPVFAAVATAALLVPFLTIGQVPGTEIIRPMAMVVLGGLVSTLLVTLFVLPALVARLPRRVPEGDAHVGL